MSKAKVVVYRTRTCPFCIEAAEFLNSRGVEFSEVPLDEHQNRRGFTSSVLPGHYTVPLIVIDDHAIGGLQELQELEHSGKLDGLLNR